MKRLKVIETDEIMTMLNETVDIIYYSHQLRTPRYNIFDQQEVVAIEHDYQMSEGHKIPCICIYCGDRVYD